MPDRIDMSDFEYQFSEGRYSNLMPNDDFEKLAFLKERIEDISGVIDLRKGRIEKINLKQIAINQIIKRIEKLLSKMREKRAPLDKERHELEVQSRKDAKTSDSLNRELARLIAELEARSRMLAERRALEDATADFPWRVGVVDSNGTVKKALPHQIEGAHRLVSAKRGILGDKPGLGKTLQAIMTIDLLRAKGKGKKVLIITPKPVLKDFERAFDRWTNPTFKHVLNQTLRGIKSEILDVITHMPEAIVITNYEVWRKDISIKHKLIACGFDTIILDEAHALKGAKSVTTMGIREIIYADNKCPQCGGQNIISSKRSAYGSTTKMCAACEFQAEKIGDFCSIKNAYFMTGTSILNKPQDLWPPLNMVDRIGFPTEKNFLDDYCSKDYDYTNQRWYYTFGPGGSERLLKKLGMKYTARTRESAGVEMPPQEVKHHYLELDPEKYPRQSKFIEQLRENARLAFSDKHQMTMQATLAWYTRMRQAASWPDGIKIKGCPHDPECLVEQPDGEWKVECYAPEVIFPPKDAPPIGESILLDESEDIITSAVESGDRIVVFSMFRSVLEELERRCEMAGLRHAKLVGGMPDKVRQGYIDDFNANETVVGEHKYDVLLCQYQTAKQGLNLHGAQQLLCVEREWNPGMEEQTVDRLRRIDSQFNSTVHLLHCAGTATELIDAIQDQKKAMLEGFEADVNLAEAMRKFLEG